MNTPKLERFYFHHGSMWRTNGTVLTDREADAFRAGMREGRWIIEAWLLLGSLILAFLVLPAA